MKALKQKIYDHYLTILTDKIKALQQKLDDLQDSLKQETKSTAGDKYETARAMVHIEQENTGRQLSELLQQQATLKSLDLALVSDTATRGSLVETDKGYLFLSIAQGKAVIEGQTVYALSPQSPLGQKLMHCGTGSTVIQNGIHYFIKNVN